MLARGDGSRAADGGDVRGAPVRMVGRAALRARARCGEAPGLAVAAGGLVCGRVECVGMQHSLRHLEEGGGESLDGVWGEHVFVTVRRAADGNGRGLPMVPAAGEKARPGGKCAIGRCTGSCTGGRVPVRVRCGAMEHTRCSWCGADVPHDDGFRVAEQAGARIAAFCRLEHIVPWAIQGAHWEPGELTDAVPADPALARCAECAVELDDTRIVAIRHRDAHRIADAFCGTDHLLDWAKAGGRWR